VLAGLGAAVVAAPVAGAASPTRRPVRYPDVDLSYFDKPITPAPFPIAFGCAAITWKEGPRKAIDEIASAGYRGVQVMANAMKDWPDPAALKAELAKRHLVLACFSGGSPGGVDDVEKEVAAFVTKAEYARAAGALRFQITSPGRNGGVDAAKLKGLAKILDEVGRRTSGLEMPVVFHNHMDQWGESPAEVDAILAATDPKLVRFLLDVGHYRAAGGDPAAAVRKHAKRLAMLHLKDVAAPSADGKRGKFVPLGAGSVDFPAVFAALKDVKYRGWVVVELDSAPDGVTALAAATANKAFVEKTVGVPV
jgi:inosose dehydratase